MRFDTSICTTWSSQWCTAAGRQWSAFSRCCAALQDAPIEFTYKSDAVALITECLIKAIEARMYVIDSPAPEKTKGSGRTR